MPRSGESISQIRDKILDQFPISPDCGLNLTRVENYIQSLGLKVLPYIVIPQHDVRKVAGIANRGRKVKSLFLSGNRQLAFTISDLDLTILIMPKKLHCPIIYEGALAHEFWHQNSTHPGTRIGFDLDHKGRRYGVFLEEGSADLVAADYIDINASKNDLHIMSKAMRRKIFSPNDKVTVVPLLRQNPLNLPIKYVVFDEDKKPNFTPSVFAGYSLELLCEQIPGLMDNLVLSRTSREGLQSTRDLLNNFAPGLFKLLNATPYNMRAFVSRLRYILALTAATT